MAQFFYILFVSGFVLLSSTAGAAELSANPWKKPNTEQNIQEIPETYEPPYERHVNANVANTVRNIPRIQRGGAGVINRQEDIPSQEPSFWEGLFGDDTANEAPASNSDSADMFGSWFNDDSTPQPASNESVINDLSNQYYSTKKTVTQTIDDAKRSVDNLTREAQKFLP